MPPLKDACSQRAARTHVGTERNRSCDATLFAYCLPVSRAAPLKFALTDNETVDPSCIWFATLVLDDDDGDDSTYTIPYQF